MTKKKFSARNFSYGLADKLQDNGLTPSINSFFEDGKEHTQLDFGDDKNSISDCKLEIEGILETYGPEDIWVDYEVNAFWSNGRVTVKITFENSDL